MKLTVKNLFSLPSMNAAKLRAGSTTTSESPIFDVMVLEYSDIENWVKPGQILLSSMHGFEDYSSSAMEEFVKKVVALGGVSLVVKTGRHLYDVPLSLINACNKYSLPLIEIPYDVKYSDIIMEVTQYLFYEKAEELKYFYQTHNQFMRLLKSELTFEKILNVLTSLLNRVVLFKNQNAVVFSTNNNYDDFNIERDLSLPFQLPLDFKRRMAYFTKLQKAIPIVSLDVYADEENSYTLHIVEDPLPLNLKEITTIDNAYSFLYNHAVNQKNVNRLKQSFHNDLLDIVLFNSSSTEHTKSEAIEQLGLDKAKNYRILAVVLEENESWETDWRKVVDRIVDKSAKYPLYKTLGHKVIVLVEVGEDEIDPAKYKEKISASIGKDLLASFQHILISNVTTVDNFPKVMTHFRESNEIIQKVRLSQKYITLADLSIYKLIKGYSRVEDIQKLIPSDLLLLYRDHEELFETFAAYIENNQSTSDAAEALFVHPKTINYRLKNVAKILNADFKKGDSILKYTIGLAIIKLEL